MAQVFVLIKKIKIMKKFYYLFFAWLFIMQAAKAQTVTQIDTNWGDTVLLPSIPAVNFSVTDYGADPSLSDNATAIQAAINAAANAGGGYVVIPAGTFMSGPFKMKSNVGLELSANTVLKMLAYSNYPGSGTTTAVAPFIDLTSTTNSWIGGSGVIDGQGADWWSAYLAAMPSGGIARPAMIIFDNANKLEIEGITIQNAPNAHISIHRGNKNVTISGVTINTTYDSPNTDGIDVWSPNVNIINCNISCGDDNIAMDNESRYITIKGCTFGRGHGLSIGSYTSGIDHIYVNNCVFNQTDNGVHVKSARGRSGQVAYLVYENLTMNGVSTPVNLCEYYPDNTIPSNGSADAAQPITATTPDWKHILLRNITATGSANAGLFWAVPELPMQDVVFDNVKIEATSGMKMNYVDTASFINGSRINVASGSAFVSTFSSTITGINLITGLPSDSTTGNQTTQTVIWSLAADASGLSSSTFLTPSDQVLGSAIAGIQYNRGYNLGGSGYQDVARTSGMQLPTSYDPNSYVEYKIAVPTGKKFTLDTINFHALGGGTGGAKMAVYYSLDGFATSFPAGQATYNGVTYANNTGAGAIPLLNTSTAAGAGNEVANINTVIVADQNTTLSIRVYAWAGSAAKYFTSKDFTLIGELSDANALPLKLLSFTAKQQQGTSVLEWKTADEINTRYFSIERSSDGKLFNSIGAVDAKNTAGEHDYSFTDAAPLFGKNYYKLKQTDADGQFSYSDIALVNNQSSANALTVYPNPATSYIILSSTNGNSHVNIYDVRGRKVSELTNVQANQKIDVSRLSSGIYLAEVINGNTKSVTRVIKK